MDRRSPLWHPPVMEKDAPPSPAQAPPPRLRRAIFVVCLAAALAAAVFVVWRVDLTPQVESDFFFSSDDPQLQASRAIAELFPSDPQILIAATGEDVLAPEYLDRLRRLSDALAAIEGVSDVKSLTHGPSNPSAVAESPVWSRLLLGSNPRLSQLVVSVRAEAEPGVTRRVESTIAEHHAPSFALEASGVPWVVELIRRHLKRDLRVFSLASLLVFALVIALVYRSARIVGGTLATCLGACALALALLDLLDKPIGLLTANLVTIVFVLTLSHIVFLTANWRQLGAEEPLAADLAGAAVRRTFTASFWCMATTLLGFASLLFASAQPLRELGFAGALGTAVAIVAAYGLYPSFLPSAVPPIRSTERGSVGPRFPLHPGRWILVGVLGLTLIAALGLPRLDTDPNLLSYFAVDDPIREGLVTVDRNGGSSPLLFVITEGITEGATQDDGGLTTADPASEEDRRLDRAEALERLAALQKSFDADPAIGSSLSLAVLLAEARRAPLAGLLPAPQLLDILASPVYDRVADNFVTPDRQRALLFLRMRETERHESRGTTIDRLAGEIRAAGFEPRLTGGLFHLQRELGALVTRSLVSGLGGLLLLFLPIAVFASRSARSSAAMLTSLVPVPLLLLGGFAWSGQPVDIITSPAANVAIALGIDSMIHLVAAVRRRRAAGDSLAVAWQNARDRLWTAIVGALLILATGFGIFALSSFPPTQRFGLAVAFGTLAAAAMALLVLPLLAVGRRGEGAR